MLRSTPSSRDMLKKERYNYHRNELKGIRLEEEYVVYFNYSLCNKYLVQLLGNQQEKLSLSIYIKRKGPGKC